LRQQLQAILDLISGREMLDADKKLETALSSSLIKIPSHEHITPEAGEPPGLWRRIQTLFGRGASRQIPQDETPILSVEASTPSLVLYCLGPFRVYQNDELITSWNGLKGQCILKYLVTQGRRPVTKDILMDLFWRDADPEAARRNLHQAIYGLRQTLRRGHPDFQHIQFENDCYLLNPEMGIWLDSTEFEKHVQAGRRLETAGSLAEAMMEYGIAEGLYQGDFLEEDLYEDWPKVRREHIRTAYLDIAGRLSKHYIQQGEHTAAIALCQKILVRDNCHEEAHHRLMRCYLAQGQRHLAVRQYQTCTETLKEELDLTPSEETTALYRHIIAAA
jgi:DNA-binding SARP family transcriptional activator